MVSFEHCDLNLDDTITCGQLFRYYKLNDNSYDIVIKDRVINVKMDNDVLMVKSNNENNLEKIVKDYFDLDRDYNDIRKKIVKLDSKLKNITNSSIGLRILRQDPKEMIISYIISANNKIIRIQNSIDMLCKKYGKKINFEDRIYYLFPDIEDLKNISIDELHSLKVGFRDKYIFDAINKIHLNEINIDKINKLNSDDALNYLMKINGVGPKVASCILLFAYSRFDVFPVDTWAIKQICNIHKNIKPNQKDVINFSKKKYKELSGIALQFMFHSLRNKNN